MKHLYYLTFVFIAFAILTSCDKSNDPKLTTPEDDEYIELSSFDGTIRNGSNSTPADGVIEIKNNEFTFVNEYGSLSGTTTLVTDEFDDVTYYQISITEADGIFDNTDNLTGEMYNDYLSVYGTSNDGQSISLNGSIMTLEQANLQWEDDRTKATVVFTNLHNCNATITLNGETLGPLQTHWQEGGLCNTPYDDALTFPKNVDNASSSLFCHDLTLKMLDGTYQTFNICDIATFIVDKETSYTYNISWDNGETASGTVKPLRGGHKKYICIDNSGVECDYEDENTNSDIIKNVSININHSESKLPSGDENTPPYIDKTVFKIVPTTINDDDFSRVTIGDRYSSTTPQGQSDTRIRLYIRNGISNGTYEIDKWDKTSSKIGVDVDFGVNGIPYSSSEYPTSGTITVSNYDASAKTCTITFTNVKVTMDGGYISYSMYFSGVVEGTFETE